MRTGNNAPIGVFDSGLGGLTVVREIMRNLPDEDIVYFGDTARVPYGSKSPETIIRYSRQIIRFLEQQQVKAIVIACNTASALALDTVEKETSLPVLGVVRPGADMAVSSTRNGRIGVIATEGTIRSGLYNRLIREADPQLQVFTKACPLFVPLVEEGWTRDPITEEVARRYLKELLEKLSNGISLSRFGIKGMDVTAEAHETDHIPYGAYVSEVVLDSPAMEAGIQSGDVITKMGTQEIQYFRDLTSTVMKTQPGDTSVVTVQRYAKGEFVEMTFEVTYGDDGEGS